MPKIKEAWQMTNEEFRQRARVWKALTPQEQQLAKKQYIKETGDEEGTKEYSPEFAMENFFYDRKTGRVLGEDIETHEWYIKQALSEGKPVPIKEPWQMTSKEWDNEVKALRSAQIEEWNKSGSKGFPPTLKINTVSERTALAEKAGYILPRDADIVIHKDYHRLSVEAALKEGKPVPPNVLNEYLNNKPKKSKQQPRPLPPEQNIQTVPFDSQLFDCYGKQTKRGFRAYCRRAVEFKKQFLVLGTERRR